MSVFRFFELLVSIGYKGVFFDVEYRKRHFPGLYCLKKKQLENRPFLAQNHGLTPLEKCQFFDLLNFLLFIGYNGVFSMQNIVKDILLPYIA